MMQAAKANNNIFWRVYDSVRFRARHHLYDLHGKIHATVRVQTKQGLLTVFTNDEGIGRYLFRDRQYEFDSSVRAVHFLANSGYIPKRDIRMLDVGANIGLIGIGLLLAGKVDHVVAIEPEPGNYDLLQENVRQNGLSDRMVCLQVAASDKESVLALSLSSSNTGDHRTRRGKAFDASTSAVMSARTTCEVKALPLAEILRLSTISSIGMAMPSFVWIDVQGFEGYVFKGATELLQRLPVVSEISPAHILDAGMSLEEFANIVRALWSNYWIDRNGRFVKYSTMVFDKYLEELRSKGRFENVIFAHAQ